MGEAEARATREGLLYALAAYGLWGLVPLYFKAVAAVPPPEVLAHRIVWSVVFLALLLSLRGRWRELGRCFRSGRVLGRLFLTAALVALNWLTYIHAVSTDRVLQASLGYFITPLVNVLLGLLFLGERLRPRQWAAVGLATAGVLNLVVRGGHFPWIALTLVASFGMYGLLRKRIAVDGTTGLAVETFLLLPAALFFLAHLALAGGLTLGAVGWQLDALLLLSGVVTAVPLICFGQAARRLRLATLGFLQYLSPSLQFLLAVAFFRESFGGVQAVSFACIWTGLALYSLDAALAYRAPAPEPVPERA